MKLKAVLYKGGKCQRCGYNKSVAAFDFHHRDPSKKDFSLGQVMRRWETVRREIRKCDLLCSNCHREHHEKENLDRIAFQKQVARLEVPARKLGTGKRCKRCRHCGKRVVGGTKVFCDLKCRALQSRRSVWPAPSSLRRMIWRKPATEIAAGLGVSSSAVKKMCKKLGVDTPPRGYWSRREQPLAPVRLDGRAPAL